MSGRQGTTLLQASSQEDAAEVMASSRKEKIPGRIRDTERVGDIGQLSASHVGKLAESLTKTVTEMLVWGCPVGSCICGLRAQEAGL